ncbi:MAG: TIGR02391 family protein [Firmicutes bacterium]|nr:TIGR02391 family protein [Bacillota bacterium]
MAIYHFIERALNPVNYTNESSRGKYNFMFEETNKALLFVGLEITREGRIIPAVQAKTLDEVDRRVNSLRKQLYNRAIHDEVKEYCIKDYLRKDYYDTVFEASKSLAERVRAITGLTADGGALFQTAFSKQNPHIFFNSLKTDSEISEFIGLKELLESIFHLVRNPAAHTPKINWKTDETKALDILTVISFAHKYLDECHRIPRKQC